MRPYLQVRMPTFFFSDNELRKLVRFFQALSQQPMPYIPEQVPVLTTKETDMARSLFSSTAAPCLKCHATGDPQHDKIATAPNFLLAKDRLKPDWAERWILDPQAISPGTSMPSGLFKRENNHWVFAGPTPPSFQGYEQGPEQTAGGLHLPADAGGAAAGGGVDGDEARLRCSRGASRGRLPARRERQARVVRGRMFCFERRRWSLAFGRWPLATGVDFSQRPRANGQRRFCLEIYS